MAAAAAVLSTMPTLEPTAASQRPCSVSRTVARLAALKVV